MESQKQIKQDEPIGIKIATQVNNKNRARSVKRILSFNNKLSSIIDFILQNNLPKRYDAEISLNDSFVLIEKDLETFIDRYKAILGDRLRIEDYADGSLKNIIMDFNDVLIYIQYKVGTRGRLRSLHLQAIRARQ